MAGTTNNLKTRNNLKKVFRDSLWYEIFLTFGVPINQLADYIIAEAIDHTRLSHTRVLADFLEGKCIKADDVIASDFGFKIVKVWSKTDREKLNKQQFHLSIHRVKRYVGKRKMWDLMLIEKLRMQTFKFMRHVERSEPAWTANLPVDWAQLTNYVENGNFYIHGLVVAPNKWCPRFVSLADFPPESINDK